jgi:hypothetical protein
MWEYLGRERKYNDMGKKMQDSRIVLNMQGGMNLRISKLVCIYIYIYIYMTIYTDIYGIYMNVYSNWIHNNAKGIL